MRKRRTEWLVLERQDCHQSQKGISDSEASQLMTDRLELKSDYVYVTYIHDHAFYTLAFSQYNNLNTLWTGRCPASKCLHRLESGCFKVFQLPLSLAFRFLE